MATSLNPPQAVAPSAAAAPDPSSVASCALASVFQSLWRGRDDAVVSSVMCCYKRPEPVLEALAGASGSVPDREGLERTAVGSAANKRLQRIDGAERSPSGKPIPQLPPANRAGKLAYPRRILRRRSFRSRRMRAPRLSQDLLRDRRDLESVLQFSPDLSERRSGGIDSGIRRRAGIHRPEH